MADVAFVPIDRAAVRLGVPAPWLRAEAEAGRIPHLRVGRRLVVDVEAVREALIRQSETHCAREAVHA